MCGVLLSPSSGDVAGQRQLRGISQGAYDNGGEGHCSRGDLTLCRERLGLLSSLPSLPSSLLTHSLNPNRAIRMCSHHILPSSSPPSPSTRTLTHSLTRSLSPPEQCMPSRVRARFCTGVACHVSLHHITVCTISTSQYASPHVHDKHTSTASRQTSNISP